MTDLLDAYPLFKNFLAVDLEGNGATPPEAVEIAVARFTDLMPQEVKTWRVKPVQPITARVRRIHGISNKDVDRAPPFGAVAEDVKRTLAAELLIIHNAHVDLDVLTRQLPCWRPGRIIDTLKLTRALFRDLSSHALPALVLHFQLDASRYGVSHNASYDAVCAGLVLARSLELALSQRLRQDTVISQGEHKSETVQARHHGDAFDRQDDLFGWSQGQTRD
jgi:exodeoxyribonuclease X